MPLQLIEDALGHPTNAHTLCRASDLAYLSADEGRKAFRDELAMEAQLFSVGNTQVWLAGNDEHLVLAFRGTESPTTIDGLKDWLLTDAMNLLIVPEGRLGHDLAAAGVGAKFHKGFADATADIWGPAGDATVAAMKQKDRPLWITGHSLGGALALFAAWLLKRRFVQVHQVYTYGAPMVGNRRACEAFDREFAGRVFRYLNGKDPVPKLPTFSLVSNEYAHVQRQEVLGADPVTTLSEFLGALAKNAMQGVLSGRVIDEVWNYITEHLSAHFLDHYRKLMGK